MTSISIPALATNNDAIFNLSNNALTSSIINTVLHQMLTVSPTVAKNIQLNGQNPPAPPTGQGIIDKQTLINAGNNVTTDGGLPTIVTNEITSITSTSASSGGNVTNDGSGSITSRGVVWSLTNVTPVEFSYIGTTSDGNGVGIFSSNLVGLTPLTTYYVKAFATNEFGTTYGQVEVFTTSPTLPTLTTRPVTSITTTTAVSGGQQINDGGATIMEKGICWSTNTNPTISLSTKTTNGTDSTGFISSISGLTANSTYYVRAYATSSVGTAYGQEVIFIAQAPASLPNVSIGSLIWSNTNLDVTTYRDGTPIPQVTDPTQWANLTSGAWCYYNNDAANGAVYGKLYNWYAVAGIYDAVSLTNASLRKQFAPTGWHVPSDNDWYSLTNFLLGEQVAGGKMKETGTTHWQFPNTAATNLSGFNGLPGGVRQFTGAFGYININGYWWSTQDTDPNGSLAWNRNLNYNSEIAFRNYVSKSEGHSVRLVKD